MLDWVGQWVGHHSQLQKPGQTRIYFVDYWRQYLNCSVCFQSLQGLPGDESVECTDSDKHMSVVVVLNSVELLVDLMRFPGQLVPFSAKAIFTSHISAAGESDSADYDSCDSPLEPNSPLCGFYERIDGERYVDIAVFLDTFLYLFIAILFITVFYDNYRWILSHGIFWILTFW